MHYQRIPGAFPAVLTAVLLVGCGACSDRSGGENPVAASPPAGSAGDEGRAGSEKEPLIRRSLLSPRPGFPEEDLAAAGEADETNRFSSVVVVIRTALVPGEEPTRSCSGVLLSPGLALTAANCMCTLRNDTPAGSGMKSLADGVACAKTAVVQSFVTRPPTPDQHRSVFWSLKVAGTVRVHPAFKLLLDAQGNIVSSEADLATITLESPIEDMSPPIETPETELEVGEPLVMIDYGYDDAHGILGDTRHFREARVTKVPPAGGWATFEQAGPHTYRGGRGGPCLRRSRDRAVVVGILNGTFARQPSFTSTYPYRLWLREELQRAAAVDTAPGEAHRQDGGLP